jgi:hypothetical protein
MPLPAGLPSFRLVADMLIPLLKLSPASGGDETRAALEAALASYTPRPLPCLLGTPTTSVWAADPRDTLGVSSLIEPMYQLCPIEHLTRRSLFESAVRVAPPPRGDSPPETPEQRAQAVADLFPGHPTKAAKHAETNTTLRASPVAAAVAALQHMSTQSTARRELSVRRSVAHVLSGGRPDTTEPWIPLFGHCTPITCGVISSRFERVASGDCAGTVTIHCTRSGRLLKTLERSMFDTELEQVSQYASPISSITITEAGRVVFASGCWVFSANLAGRPLACTELEDTVVAMVPSPSGRFLAVATRGQISLLEASTLEQVNVIDSVPPAPIRSLALSRDGRAILAGFDRGLLGIYATDTTYYAAV